MSPSAIDVGQTVERGREGTKEEPADDAEQIDSQGHAVSLQGPPATLIEGQEFVSAAVLDVN